MTGAAVRHTQTICRQCGRQGVARILAVLDNEHCYLLPPPGWYILLQKEGGGAIPYKHCLTCPACAEQYVVAALREELDSESN